MKLKFEMYNQWKKLKTNLFIIDVFRISFHRVLDYYKINVVLFGVGFMIELFFDEDDTK